MRREDETLEAGSREKEKHAGQAWPAIEIILVVSIAVAVMNPLSWYLALVWADEVSTRGGNGTNGKGSSLRLLEPLSSVRSRPSPSATR